jgi:hypothetical protein
VSIPDIDYTLGLSLGQFEYTVPLSPVKPEDIQRVAREFLEKKNELEKQEEKNA